MERCHSIVTDEATQSRLYFSRAAKAGGPETVFGCVKSAHRAFRPAFPASPAQKPSLGHPGRFHL